VILAAAAALLGVFGARPALAANVVLTDGNSSVTIDPTSTAGVQDWTLNGQNQLNQEWFWFRSGNSAGQSSLNSLGTPAVTLLDTNGNGQNDTAELVYGPSNGLQITVTYSLTGGQSGSKTSDLTDSIQITNKGSKTLKFHFFQYADFNLGDSTTGQSVTIANSDTATDTGNGYKSQTVVSPQASEFEANVYPKLLNEISGSSPYTLSGANTSAAADGEWAFEWDQNIPMCGSMVITGDQEITGTTSAPIPEPKGASLAVLGTASMLLIRRRRQITTV